MPKQQHHPWGLRGHGKGANPDLEQELHGQEKNLYVDAKNVRVTNTGGDSGAAANIKGEKVKYNNPKSSGDYQCIGASEVNDHIVEFWADREGTEDSLIRVDGDIVCESSELYLTWNNPLQIDKNENCIGGEVAVTDFKEPPLIFNVQDLIDNFNDGTTKYFADFNPRDHQFNLISSLHHPQFIRLLASGSAPTDYNVLGSGGLDVGLYQYAVRWKDQSGNTTQWSVNTPMIPVVANTENEPPPDTKTVGADNSYFYPFIQTYGEDAATNTGYGIHLKLRVDNVKNYQSFEIKRIGYNSGNAIGTVPDSEIIAEVSLTEDERDVYDLVDDGATAIEVLTDEEETTVMSKIKRCRSLRFFDRRTVAFNVEFADRDLEGEFSFKDSGAGNIAYPISKNIGKGGHKDPYNFTYHRAYQHGEKYGFALAAFDERAERAYAIPLTGFENYQMPNRRDEMSSDSSALTTGVKAATVDGTVGETFEIFDQDSCVKKDGNTSLKNIYPSQGDYEPYRPIGEGDNEVTEHQANVKVITEAKPGDPSGSTDGRWDTSYELNYNPKGFAPDIRSMGLAVDGFEDLPDWVEAFSVVRTKPADRVFSQGIAFYDLDITEDVAQTKSKNSFIFQGRDTDEGLVDIQDVIDDVNAGNNNYKIQFISPLGVFSEVYNYNKIPNDPSTYNRDGVEYGDIDMITYTNLMRETGEINPGQSTSEIGIDDGAGNDGYIAYGKWRDPSKPGSSDSFPDCGGGNTEFAISNIQAVTSGRTTYYRITIDDDLYRSDTFFNTSFDDPSTKQGQEPVYIVNIVAPGNDVEDDNIDQFIETGHYQKIESTIGLYDGSQTQFELVDERPFDCIPKDSTENRYIYIKDTDDNEERWLNVNNFSTSLQNTIFSEIETNGKYTDSDGNDVYGVYFHSSTTVGTAEVYSILFQQTNISFDADVFFPPTDSEIVVKYDNRVPIEVFGGDVVHSDELLNYIDNETNNGDISYVGVTVGPSGPRRNMPMPYPMYEIHNELVIDYSFRIDPAEDYSHKVSLLPYVLGYSPTTFDNKDGFVSTYRQAVVSYISSNRYTGVFDHNDKPSGDAIYPLTNYVMKPWDSTSNVYAQWSTDYGNITTIGRGGGSGSYGGFMIDETSNLDYSHAPNKLTFVTKPEIGFDEENHYCTGIAWTDQKNTNEASTLTARSFPGINFFQMDEDTGEIKYGWDSISGKGSNLYAFTENGICLLLTNKRTLTDLGGGDVGYISDADFISEQIWISKDIGMDGQFWRSAKEIKNKIAWVNRDSVYELSGEGLQDLGRRGYYSRLFNDLISQSKDDLGRALVGAFDRENNEYWVGENRDEIEKDFSAESGTYNAYFVDEDYATSGDNIIPVIEGTLVKVTPNSDTNILIQESVYDDGGVEEFYVYNESDTDVIDLLTFQEVEITSGTYIPNITTFYNLDPKEVIKVVFDRESANLGLPIWRADETDLDVNDGIKMFAYNYNIGAWNGFYSYDFDQFLLVDTNMYGMRDLETYDLNTGFEINSADINSFVTVAYAPNPAFGNEFIRIRANSSVQPDRIELFETHEQYKNGDVQATINGADLRQYDGYEQYVPRKDDGDRDRFQGRLLIAKIIFNLDSQMVMPTTAIQTKQLK